MGCTCAAVETEQSHGSFVYAHGSDLVSDRVVRGRVDVDFEPLGEYCDARNRTKAFNEVAIETEDDGEDRKREAKGQKRDSRRRKGKEKAATEWKNQ